METQYKTIIIGAGQAGLATGYFLKKFGEDFVIFDSNEQVGDSWRNRWDSLRLFTPAQYDGLPGYPFPSARGTYPTKDELADYLVSYAKRFDLPVLTGTTVTKLTAIGKRFELIVSGQQLTCDKVVIATGTNPVPHIPHYAAELDKGIHQLHSCSYKNPSSLPPGDVLVVGAGTSGIEIALEVSKTRRTFISGHPTFHIPDAVFRYAGRLYWWFAMNVITTRTPIGRKAKEHIIHGGSPLIRVTADDLDAAGVERLPRVKGVLNGQPLVEDGRAIPVSTIVWSTGFRPEFSWIDPPVTDGSGWPVSMRGVHPDVKGLYFVGMLFQFGLTSGLVGGVGRDARYVAQKVHAF